MNVNEKIKDRDQKRGNNSHRAVQGFIYNHIISSGLSALINSIETSENIDLDLSQKLLSLIGVVGYAQNEMVTSFSKSQTSINKDICSQYANSQFHQVENMIANRECLSVVKDISEYVVDEKMIHYTKKIYDINQSGKYLIYVFTISSFW